MSSAHLSLLFCSSLLFLLLLRSASTAAAAHNIITSTCTRSAKSDPNIHYNFCVESLSGASKRHRHRHRNPTGNTTAALKDLSVLAAKVAIANATQTRSHIKILLKSHIITDKYVKGCLEDCLELYTDAVPTLKRSARAIRQGRLADANVWVSSVLDAATTCDDGFKEKEGVENLMEKNDRDMFELGAITLSIMSFI